MNITIAQINPTVGDVSGNLSKIINIISKADQTSSDLVIFPELSLVGYPPRDLLFRNWFIRKVEQAIEELKRVSEKYSELGILVGAPTKNDKPHGVGLFNSALLIHHGEIIFSQHKTLLPSYDVFDEPRYFDQPDKINTVAFKDEVLGISICEDAWNDKEMWGYSRRYEFDPIQVLSQKGASLLINISASPFSTGKIQTRYRIIQNHAKKYGIPFIYVNQVGGNDDLIFDGNSIFLDKMGDLVFQSPSFKEDIELVDSDESGSLDIVLPEDQIESVYKALVLGLEDYTKKCGFSKVVLGLSGGIDSAVTCCLAERALGKENVLTISMTSPYSSDGSVDDSRILADNLGVEFKVIPISGIYYNYLESLQKHFGDEEIGVTEENIQARIRGNILMAFSNEFGYMVLSTGNKSELAVGYCTLYGDMTGGLAVLADVPKTMVYDLAEFINSEKEIIPESIIKKPPSAELRPDQKDQDTLPPYPILDKILYFHIEKMMSTNEIIENGYDPDMVKWVVEAVANNEYKRRQAAPGLKVTSKAFGAGRRMPIAAKYSEGLG